VVSKEFFGQDACFDHVGIAVRSIDDAVTGAQAIVDPVQKVAVAFININNFRVELVEPLNEASPICNMLKKQQNLYHICFKVNDIEGAIEQARKNSFHCIANPVPAIAFENKRIAWLFSRTYGLIELLEK